MKLSVIFVYLMIFWCADAAKYIPIVDEEVINCGSSGYLDFSGFHLEAINDTVKFSNSADN